MNPLALLASPLGGKVTIFAFIALIVGAGAYIGIQKIEINSLNSQIAELTDKNVGLTVDNTILRENAKVLRDNINTLALANETNYNTARHLLEERGKATQAIANLAAVNRRSAQSLERLNLKIEEMLKDPAADGPVAPVLREIIREIQKERAR